MVLTPGVYNSAYFEHALLARMMGEMEPASMPKEKPDLATRVAAWTAAPPTYQEVFERHLKKRKREN